MTIRNGELYLVYMKTYDVVSVFENICDYYYMNQLISEESTQQQDSMQDREPFKPVWPQ